MRTTLVAALSECVDSRTRKIARRFLQGLSADELQYIAEFLGAYILEPPERSHCSRRQLAEWITEFERSRRSEIASAERPSPAPVTLRYDQDHKMILLLEYLCRSGLPHSVAMRAGQA